MIGRKRRLTASNWLDLYQAPRPQSTRTLANSTIRMAFLAASPIRVISPICAYTLLVRRGTAGKRQYSTKRADRHGKQNRKGNRPAFV